MGEPALQLEPAEEVVAEQAGEQTAKFVVIEGGKDAAVGAGEELAGQSAARGLLAGAGAELAAIGGVLLILLWPSPIAPDPPMPRYSPGSATPTSSSAPGDTQTCGAPTAQNDSEATPPSAPASAAPPDTERDPDEKKCPPHLWVVVESHKPEETINDRRNLATKTKNPDQARGYNFEADAIEENGKLREIEATDRKYRCARCGKETEVDILFKDGQIGEASSKKAKQVASGKRDQAKLQNDLQRQLNQDTNTTHMPMAKVDNSKDLNNTVDQNGRSSKQIFEERGYQVELLPGSS